MQSKLTILAALAISVCLVNSAYAHKSEVIGDYKVEIGWDKEPPVAGMDNKITVMITHASSEEKVTAEKDSHDEMAHDETEHEDHEESAHDETEHEDHEESAHDETEHEDHEDANHKHGEGISGLTSSMDVTVTLNNEKTTLTMMEDEDMPGLYSGEFTPTASGFPTVHLFVEIDGEPLEIDMHPEKVEDGAVIKTMTSDGSVNVDVITTTPTADEGMIIRVEFTDAQGSPIEHVNYDIVATQDGSEVLSESEMHSHEGDVKYSTEALSSNDPVDIQVKILGIGLPDEKANWNGPVGETISLNVVPEFGPIAVIVLTTAIISIVTLTRSKIIPRLY